MKLTVNKHLNARTDAKIAASVIPHYLEPGSSIEIVRVKKGEELDGNALWYKSTEGYFYWSGGFVETEFELSGQKPGALPAKICHYLLSSAMEHYYGILKKSYPLVTGISMRNKNKKRNQSPALILQLPPKSRIKQVPESVMYMGYRIKVKIEYTGLLKLNWGPFANQLIPGGSLATLTDDSAGTCGFKAYRFQQDGKWASFIVTNYHVAAWSLLLAGQNSYADDGSKQKKIFMPAEGPKNAVGYLQEGDFTLWLDTALIRLHDDIYISDQLFNKIKLSESSDIYNQDGYEQIGVEMYGAMSGLRKGVIQCTIAVQEGSVNGVDFEKRGLIQIKLDGAQSEDGDSGAPVLMGNYLIGIIIGNDGEYSYLIPVQRILNQYEIKLTQS